MVQKLKVAAVQMDAAPAPVDARLERAADLISEAAASGAQLVVLPEVFNTGYEYADHNYTLPEPQDGRTVTWMKAQAAQHQIHLAGSLLLLDGWHVYNALLLVAPDGRTWRYDKNYPWAWERAYFREGHGITIAETDLGKLGMMICWDHTHADLWEQYAGKVDALVIASCPPMVDRLKVVPPASASNGEVAVQLSPELLYTGQDMPFGAELDAHVAWIGVPAVHTTGSGKFSSSLPLSKLSLAGLMIQNPELRQYFPEADQVHVESGYFLQTKVIDHHGQVLARVTEEGDRFALSEIELAETPPQPSEPQPSFHLTLLAYFASDWLTPTLMNGLYRAGLRRQFGGRMAPLDRGTKLGLIGAAAAFVAGFVLGRSQK